MSLQTEAGALAAQLYRALNQMRDEMGVESLQPPEAESAITEVGARLQEIASGTADLDEAKMLIAKWARPGVPVEDTMRYITPGNVNVWLSHALAHDGVSLHKAELRGAADRIRGTR